MAADSALGKVCAVRPFRFGYQSTIDEPAQVLAEARQAEQAGFDIFQLGDHVGTEPSPLVTLAAVAGRRSTSESEPWC